jgi:hypothetical protein
MKTWKKAVLWIIGIVAVALVAGAAYWAGFIKGQMSLMRDQTRFNLALRTTLYSKLKALETDELAQKDDWTYSLSNLKTLVFSDVAFVELHPGYFEFEGRDKERFERCLQTARDLIADIELVPMRQAVEKIMGTTNLTVKVGRDSISVTRNEIEE